MGGSRVAESSVGPQKKKRKLESVTCNQCGADDTQLRYVVDGFRIVECKTCRLMYVNPRVAQSELKDIYSESYYQNKNHQSYNEKFFSDYIGERKARTEEFARKVEEIVSLLGPRRGRLLDIGCAAGFFLDAAREQGFKAEGVEISEFSSRYARDELGLKVHTGSLEEAQFPADSFDVVTAWDCVELCRIQPLSFLRSSASSKKEVGRLLKR